MCGRFSNYTPIEESAAFFELERVWPGFQPRYNISPAMEATIIRSGPQDGKREAISARWGLIPSWAKDPFKGPPLINARSETVGEKPAFRKAVKSRRCLVPANGFYEWARSKSRKTPFYFRMKGESPLAMAGLWEFREDPEGDILSFTILTTQPNELVSDIHDRMPVILDRHSFGAWLDLDNNKVDGLTPLFAPFSSDKMTMYQVNALVNKTGTEGPECIAPVEERGQLLLF